MLFYKYISFDRFGDLGRGRIRFTQPGAFNDPFEMPAFKTAEAEAARAAGLAGLSQQTEDIMKGLSAGQIPKAAFTLPISYFFGWNSPEPRERKAAVPSEEAIEKLRRIDTEFGILSLSATADNLLLWAHYASEHRGLAVEIDTDHRGFKADQGAERAKLVVYSNLRPRIPETDEILFEHFFTKSPEWAYEQEFRIVRRLASSVEQKAAVPFPIHLFRLPPGAIRRVIFGARVSSRDRAGLMLTAQGDPELAHVAFAEAVLDPAQFRMEIRALREAPFDAAEMLRFAAAGQVPKTKAPRRRAAARARPKPS